MEPGWCAISRKREARVTDFSQDRGDRRPVIVTARLVGLGRLRRSPADGFAVFPAGDREYAAGEIVGYLPMR